MFILDFGSGNTCNNDINYVTKMIDALAEIDTERKCIIKWQLFEESKVNRILQKDVFVFAYSYAASLGFQTTASVFDYDSLQFLLKYFVPFIKIANSRELYHLISHIPRKVRVIKSGFSTEKEYNMNVLDLCCVSEYPAHRSRYEARFTKHQLSMGISDHTVSWELYEKYKPYIYECHFCLEHNDDNPDAGFFSRTPEQLKQIYEEIF